MKRLKRRFNRFYKDHGTSLTFLSGGLIIIGFLALRIFGQQDIRNILYILATIISGLPILDRAISGLKFRAIGIELLVSIAVIGALIIGEYTEAAVVTFLFQFGAYLENRTLMKTRSAIKTLTEMAPARAFRLSPGQSQPEEIDVDEVEVDDILMVNTGGQVPVDGIIDYGQAYINEASINGESVPRNKSIGDEVYAGTIVDSGTIHLKAKRVGEDTTFSKIIELVEEAQDSKSEAEKFIDSFARYYTPAVIVLALVVYIFTRDVSIAITVLVLGCPGALVIGAPVANVAGIGKGAQDHILLKGGESIATYAKTDIFVFDKTGTLTQGSPSVDEIHYYTSDKNESLKVLGLVEKTSDHPLAKALIDHIRDLEIDLGENIPTKTLKGLGMEGTYQGDKVLVGNQRLMEENGIVLSQDQVSHIQEGQSRAGSIVILARDQEVLLIAVISDQIKEGAQPMIDRLKDLGVKKTVMLTGDSKRSGQAVASAVGIDEVRSDLLPEDKLRIVKEYQDSGANVAFVGDGINDSPALAQSQTGIAMGAGTDVAIETSDLVLVKSDLASIPRALDLSKRTIRIMRQNIVIAVGVVIFLLIGLILGYVNMSIGMLVHEGSILVVILNAMRLLY